MTETQYWHIAVEAPLLGALTYSAPQEIQDALRPGQLVEVPLGRRKARGVLLSATQVVPEFAIKSISSIITEHRPLPEPTLRWLQWVADYYLHPVGATMGLAYPPLKKAKSENSTRKRSAVEAQVPADIVGARTLTPEQNSVLEKIAAIRKQQSFSTHLLFGVTGSGKTEVYMQLLQTILEEGRSGLVLVPEISLTPQLIQRFVARFGDKVATLHSQLTERERTNQWWDVVEGRKKILIGARSALFCPIENLGLIVVDEEHESSFKQEEKLKYHGRDAAVVLAKMWNCPIVLGSATPSLESWKNAQDGRYFLHQMQGRVEDRALPQIHVVDLRATPIDPETGAPKEKNPDLPAWLSPQLFQALQDNFEKGFQSALFLNRRGAAALVICPDCGYTHQCPNCDINLTLHGHSHLVCHYCDYHLNFQEACPDCKEGAMTPVGLGTEALEKETQRLFPQARLARADRDEITNRLELEDLIERMEKREIDILIGTQMIAKGLDFPGLNLVGVVLADIGFNLPDFRATERSFQLLTQVAGRSGRHVKKDESPGQVIVQTFNPDHPSLEFALRHDYPGFADIELQHRQALSYPPQGRLTSIRVQGVDLAKVQNVARLFGRRGEQLRQQNLAYVPIEILGPAPAPIAKLRGKFRFHLLLKSPNAQLLNRFCRHVLGDEDWVQAGVRIAVDVDPLHLL